MHHHLVIPENPDQAVLAIPEDLEGLNGGLAGMGLGQAKNGVAKTHFLRERGNFLLEFSYLGAKGPSKLLLKFIQLVYSRCHGITA